MVDMMGLQDAVKDCYHDAQELLLDPYWCLPSKRKVFRCSSEPQSPVGVLEAATLSSCASESTMGSSRESSPGVCLAPPSSSLKRRKLDEQHCVVSSITTTTVIAWQQGIKTPAHILKLLIILLQFQPQPHHQHHPSQLQH